MKELFKKYRRKLALIGIAKSVFLGSVAGLFLCGLTALILWFTDVSLLVSVLVPVGVFALTLFVGTPLLYVFYYRPSDRYVLSRVDALGLEERAVTMCEQENNPSPLAALQRRDAQSGLHSVSEKKFRFSMAAPFLLVFLVCFFFALSFTTVTALAAEGYLGGGREVVLGQVDPEKEAEKLREQETYYTVTYLVYGDEGGAIEGETEQEVKKGSYSKAVTAVPAEGYDFYAWVDADNHPMGSQSNPRIDLNVRSDLEVYARFLPKPEEGDQKPDEEEPEDPNDPDEDKDLDTDVDGEIDKPDVGEKDPNTPSEDEEGEEGLGRENNNVIDGKQDYQDVFDREQSERDLNDDTTIPDELKDVLGDYYNGLKP